MCNRLLVVGLSIFVGHLKLCGNTIYLWLARHILRWCSSSLTLSVQSHKAVFLSPFSLCTSSSCVFAQIPCWYPKTVGGLYPVIWMRIPLPCALDWTPPWSLCASCSSFCLSEGIQQNHARIWNTLLLRCPGKTALMSYCLVRGKCRIRLVLCMNLCICLLFTGILSLLAWRVESTNRFVWDLWNPLCWSHFGFKILQCRTHRCILPLPHLLVGL